jgi:threonine/homoserine/homoserine lactone efflux protein
MSALALVVGAAAGFAGAIPPGPVGLAVASHASEGRAARALRVGIGAALVDATLCAAIGLGAGPTLVRLTAPAPVRVFVAIAYAALGVFLLAETLLRPGRVARPSAAPTAARGDGFARGALRGVTNPSLIANWTLVVTALGAADVLPPGPIAAFAFALGVGVGVGGWFAVLTRLVAGARARGERIAPWLRGAGALTGALLLAGGGVGVVRALAT